MSRLPCVNTTGVPPPASKLAKRQSSLDLRRKKQHQELPPPLKPSKSSTRLSRNSVSSYDEMDSPSSRFSASSFGSIQTNMTSPRSSLVTSPKPSGPRKRLSIKPPPIPTQHLPSQQQKKSTSHDGLYLDERVVVDSMNIVSTLRYLGEINIKPGIWAGIELDIAGTGKNDGSVQGVQYFKCPSETGIFVAASKVAPLDHDDMSTRSMSPPSPCSITSHQSNGRSVTRVTKGSRAERYIGMTASQLTQRQQQPKRLSNASTISTGSNGTRHPQLPPMQSPTPTSHRRRLSRTSSSSSSSTRPRSFVHQQQQHDDMDDYYAQDDSIVISDEHMLTDTPVPVNLATSESTDIPTSSVSCPPQDHLERVLGEAIAQAPDETAMRLQQLHLRVQVLEAENKYLKLENTQNKTAEQILSRSMVLRNKVDGEDDSYFTLEGHKAIVAEIMQDHETKKKVWETDMTTMRSSIKKLENRVFELETEQSELIHERDELLTSIGDVRKIKNQMEQKVQELEQNVQALEQNLIVAQTSSTVQTTANFYSSDPDEMQERQRQMEMEMEQVHDKMTSLMDAMRAKDMFLGTLSNQVEQHRNLVEEKERELRRVRLESERHTRDKERLREEINDLETKWVGHEGCVTREEFDRLKRDYAIAKEHLIKETSTVDDYKKRIHGLELTVDELKAAGMESIDLYENSVELHRVAMETIQANLQDEQRKVAALELENAHLIKTGADTLDTFEGTMTALKQQHASKLQAFDTERQGWEETIAKLKQEISQLVDSSNQVEQMDQIKQVWDSERHRLEEAIERHVQQLGLEQAAHQALKQKMEQVSEQSKQADKLALEKQQLEEQVQQLQGNYDEQLQARGRYLEEVRVAVEGQNRIQADLRRLTEAKDKVDRELELARADLTKAESTLTSLRSTCSDVDDWVKEKKQQAQEIATFRGEIERLEAQNDMLIKQKESAELAASSNNDALIKRLKGDNEKLTKDHDTLKESYKQMESECLKLMDEVEKLHSDGPTNDEDPLLTDDQKALRLERQLAETKRHMDKLILTHSSEMRKIKEQLQEAERNHHREIKTLNRDVTELESIIEAKIFKEADLETALENERKTAKLLREELKVANGGPQCDFCKVSDHDLTTCNAAKERPFCENCDEHGLHTTAHCPNQNETF